MIRMDISGNFLLHQTPRRRNGHYMVAKKARSIRAIWIYQGICEFANPLFRNVVSFKHGGALESFQQ
eukprot:UN16527